MQVKCPACKMVYLETTDKFMGNTIPNGSMVQLVEPYKSRGWATFGDYNGTASTECSMMVCPGCTAPLAPSGRLLLVKDENTSETSLSGPEPAKNEFVCPVCGKACKAKIGLVSHMRTHKAEKSGQ